MDTWHDYRGQLDPERHTVVGDIQVLRGLWSSQLRNHRDLLIYLPPSYNRSTQHYPVVYMHDGQNLFDERSSHAGEWRVDETMEMLSGEGLEALIVGVPNAGERRLDEYTPFRDRRHGGGDGDRYVRFVIDTIKPLVDETFRTLPTRESTFILGSSLGGLISLYAFFRYPAIFGGVGALSPSVWYAGGEILRYIRHSPPGPGRIYLDVGGRELSNGLRNRLLARSLRYRRSVRGLYRLLLQRGYSVGRDLLYVEDRYGRHHESDWARRLPDALRFLLSQTWSLGKPVLY